jgi:sodium transport system permease protein
MNWKNVKLILLREIRDQLRDRRTLFMVAILPLLLYPAMGIGMVSMMTIFSEQSRTVVVLGTEHLPEQPKLLRGDRFVRNWFRITTDASKLHVVTDLAPKTSNAQNADTNADIKQRSAILKSARAIRKQVEARDALEQKLDTIRERWQFEHKERTKDEWRALAKRMKPTETRLETVNEELGKLFSSSDIQVLIIVPDEFGANIEALTLRLSKRDSEAANEIEYQRLTIVQNSADEKSMIAYRPIHEAIDEWETKILEERLISAKLPASMTRPVNQHRVDLAKSDQLAANLWSKLFPTLLVIMAVTGAFYPAVDLAAGEKERGTMETLLICPATRAEIVLGKFFTVMLFSFSTALLNLGSMGFTGKYMASIGGAGTLSKLGDLSFPPLQSLMWVIILLIPLAALFSALCLSLATFARSSKEGQYYLTPLLMVTMGLTVFCLSPGVEIRPFYSVMPVVGPALLLKELLASPGSTKALIYAIPVLITSVGYSLLALWWAIDQFNREDVLFREAERFDPGLWIRHLLRDKESTPSFAEAGFCFGLIMFMQFGAMRFFKEAFDRGLGMDKILLIQQLVIIATPALLMGLILTTNFRRTLRLYLPSWRMLGVAALLPCMLHPLTLEMMAVLQKWFFLPLPESMTKQLATMANPDRPLWMVLLVFAAAPALCEEIAFRGFILSGFSRSKRVWLAVGLSALTFGIMHMIPQQVFYASLLGLVIGLIAVRSNSLLPCILFHFVFNSLDVMRRRFGDSLVVDGTRDWLFTLEEGGLRFQWGALTICALVAIVLLRWLINHSANPTTAVTRLTDHATDRTADVLPGATEKPSVGAH